MATKIEAGATLGDALLQHRKARGISMKDAAAELACHENSYRLWELGVQIPGGKRLNTVRRWLDITADKLLELLEATPGYLAFAS